MGNLGFSRRAPGREPRPLVLGTGPAGLAAGLLLARAGKRPLLIERSAAPGGMMRGIVSGDYSLDLGRKELYDRVPEVRALYRELLGDDYLPYAHRVGVLYEGTILEYSSRFRGKLRGAPPAFLARAFADLIRARLSSRRPPESLEEALTKRRGALITRAFSQGYQEKFTGVAFSERPPPSREEGLARALEAEAVYHHPRLGTQQIVDAFAEAIHASGGEFLFGAELEKIVSERDEVSGVFLRSQGSRVLLSAKTVVSALPILSLARALGLSDESLERESWNRKRLTLLGYFLTDAPIASPHAWLLVSCGRMKIARITNYAGFGGAMVPAGKGAIAAEIFLSSDDPFHQRSDEAVLDSMERELVSSGIIDGDAIARRFLIRLPGAEAANDYHNWERPAFQRLGEEVARVGGLYDVNRAGIDIAMHAGMEAARAIVSGDKERFIKTAAPSAAYDDFTRLS